MNIMRIVSEKMKVVSMKESETVRHNLEDNGGRYCKEVDV